MSIADKLIELDEVKQDLKEAIEAKGADLTDVEFRDYAGKLNTVPAWVRPSEWPQISHLVTSQCIVGVYAIPDDNPNLQPVAFSMTTDSGTWDVDWGDGTTSTGLASGALAQKHYDKNNINLTTTSYGYKCAVIQIRPSSTNNITSINLKSIPTTNGVWDTNSWRCYTWLELNLQLPSVTVKPSISDFRSLVSASLSIPLITSMSNMFQNCYALQSIPAMDTSSVTDASLMFLNCRALTRIGVSKFPNVTNPLPTSATTANYNLGPEALNEIFTALPTASGTRVINITWCKGRGTANKTIATGKGWTVTG